MSNTIKLKGFEVTFKTPQEVLKAFWQGNEHLRPMLKTREYGDVLSEEWFNFLDMLSNDNHATEATLSEANKIFINSK
jgi:hypothetical protein